MIGSSGETGKVSFLTIEGEITYYRDQVSVINKFWVFTVISMAFYFFLVWKAAENPRYVPVTLLVLVISAVCIRRFRCPHCHNPIMKRRSTERPVGYVWRIPTSRNCVNCGAAL